MTTTHGPWPRAARGMRLRLAVAVAFGTAAAFAVPSIAQERPYDFKLFGSAARIAPQGDSALPGVASSVEASSETGLDIDVGESFAVLIGLRWLDASVDSDSLPSEVSVDPLTARVGVAFRF